MSAMGKGTPWLVGILLLSIVASVLLGVHLWLPRAIADPAVRGQYGDMFGLADAIFTGLGFVGAGVALWWQAREIRGSLREQHEKLRALVLSSLVQALDTADARGDARTLKVRGVERPIATLKLECLQQLVDEWGEES